ELEQSLPQLDGQVERARTHATAMRLGLEALQRHESLVAPLQEAETESAYARDAAREITDQLTHFASESSRISSTLSTRREKLVELDAAEGNVERNLRGVETRVTEIDRKLAELVVSEEAKSIEVASVEVLEHDLERLAAELADEQRYPEEVRGELVL